jgi:hypothetical protein
MFLIHLVACLWFLTATLEESLFETWVGAKGLVDADKPYQYFNAFYWAFQTTTTVGYGDFSIQTTPEYVIATIWMVLGTSFFSFTIGSVSTLIAALDEKNLEIS